MDFQSPGERGTSQIALGDRATERGSAGFYAPTKKILWGKVSVVTPHETFRQVTDSDIFPTCFPTNFDVKFTKIRQLSQFRII
jgi:hypothetical protein